ncbi:DUF2510 domain-containing protein [Rhodococcus hoagii]|nr:DUF2510 domain-containing protein [Prescottella equi]
MASRPRGVPNQLRWWDGRQWTSATHPVETNTDVEPPPEAGQPSPNRRRNKSSTPRLVLAVAAAGIVGSMALQGGDSEDGRSSPVSSRLRLPPPRLSRHRRRQRRSVHLEPLSTQALPGRLRDAVKDRLKSPQRQTPDNNTRKNADGSFQVRGVVDSDNSFGATTRSYFGCTVIPAGLVSIA